MVNADEEVPILGTAPTTVVVVDDHAPTRSLIVELLSGTGFDAVGQAATARGAIEAATRLRPDVVLLDIEMPGSGIHAARVLSRSLPGTTVVMLTASEEDADLFEAVRAGAKGYLVKSAGLDDLAAELRAVLDGRPALSPALMTRILKEFRRHRHMIPSRARLDSRLTEREREVMELLAEGRSTEEVAGSLFITATTVRVHVSSVVRKLQARDREQAVRLLHRG
ncbi:response regulator transcription factor [Nocardioides caldifontis]|uniref:response regulator transcription factor n=1 Tax=Nocardioides caldifontis TaxID=2588938 RepID=UPI0011DF12FF|nr:response regulator transcription factor [Nocardioides caldifontis]